MCWRAGCDSVLLRYRCDGELGVIESYCGFGVMELRRAGCDGELATEGWCDGEILRAESDGELGAMVRY